MHNTPNRSRQTCMCSPSDAKRRMTSRASHAQTTSLVFPPSFGDGLLIGYLVLCAPWACLPEDLGTPCPDMDDLAATGEANVTGIYPEVVEIKTTFPCDALTCVSTGQAQAFCSRECRNDAGCPAAFECRQVGTFGPLSHKKYCVWRECTVPTECGDVSRYECLLSETTGVGRCNLVD
jgi:hypothetical protein